jgi:hypothetical protein
MRHCSILLFVLLVAAPAFAGQNPDVRIYLDFDPPNGVSRIDPVADSTFDVYIVLDHLGAGGGVRGVAPVFERTFGGTLLSQTNLLGGMDFYSVDDTYGGWVHLSGTDCAHPSANGLLVTGFVTYLYNGTPGYMRIQRPEVDPGMVVDCDFAADYFCVAGNAGVGMDAPSGEPGCGGASPVESVSWSSIKALYR